MQERISQLIAGMIPLLPFGFLAVFLVLVYFPACRSRDKLREARHSAENLVDREYRAAVRARLKYKALEDGNPYLWEKTLYRRQRYLKEGERPLDLLGPAERKPRDKSYRVDGMGL